MNKLLAAAKSKTIWFALVLAIFGVVEMQIHIFAKYMSQEAFGLFSIAVGVIVAILRVLTTMPLSEK